MLVGLRKNWIKWGNCILFHLILTHASFAQNVYHEFEEAKGFWLGGEDSLSEDLFKSLEQKFQTEPEMLAQCYYYLGNINHVKGNFKAAIVYNKKILELDIGSEILKHSTLNGDHLKHLACSTLADIYLASDNYKEALFFLSLESTKYSTSNSETLSGHFIPPDFVHSLNAKRWGDAYSGLGKYDSAVFVLLPYSFGEDRANQLVFDKLRMVVTKAYDSATTRAETKKMLSAGHRVDLKNRIIEIDIFQKSIRIPIDNSLQMYFISQQTVRDFLLNSKPVQFLLSADW